MVTRGTYFDEDEQYSRRYMSRGHGHGYPLSQDRELPSALHGPYGRQHMPSQNRQSPEQDKPRRRIPVACGRCRKRKIRCSGDPGNGKPCSNCQSAGSDTCLFLRVSSTEAQLKSEPAAEFSYDSAAPRAHCRMSSYGPQHHQSYPNHHPNSLAQDYPSYRNNSLSYQKSYGLLPPYTEYSDENEFGISTGYPMIAQEPLSMAYSTANSIRLFQGQGQSQGQQFQKAASLFVDEQPSYTHEPQLWSPGLKFPMRPQVNSESKSLSLNGMSSALPVPGNGTNRVLPFPASSRSLGQVLACPTYLQSTESILPMTQNSLQYNNNGLMSAHMSKALNSNVGVSSESASLSYLPLSSSPESVPSSHMSSLGSSFGGNSVSSGSHMNDQYTHSHENPMQRGLISNGSSENLSESNYRSDSNAGLHRSSVCHSSNGENVERSHEGTLANGHFYHPPPASQPSYATPPIVDNREMSVPTRHPVST